MFEREFERLLSLPALPAANATGHGYATTIVTDSNEQWSLRAADTEFGLIARAWLHTGLTRCYSVGWGLTDSGQTPALLLAQAFIADEPAGRRLGRDLDHALEPLATHVVWTVSPLWGRSCLRLSAQLRECNG